MRVSCLCHKLPFAWSWQEEMHAGCICDLGGTGETVPVLQGVSDHAMDGYLRALIASSECDWDL